MITRVISGACAVLLLVGCAHEPIVDRKGVSEVQYQQDLAECRAYAEEVDTLEETVQRGAVGAAVGSVLGAILGDSGTAGKGAGIGAASGGSKGFGKAERRKERVMYNCMKGRGYRVLG